MAASPTPPTRSPLNPGAAVLAWLWPGLGHIARGERQRGFLIMFGILLLFVTGLLVGGLDAVDRRNDRLWFLAQSVCGPIAIGADLANQAIVQQLPADWRELSPSLQNATTGSRVINDLEWSPHKDEELRRRYEEGDPVLIGGLQRIGVGRVNEIGTLYIALAGLMNLVVILDALYARTPTPAEAPAS